MKYPFLNEIATTQQVTDVFTGLDLNARIAEGAMSAEQNICSDGYPVLCTRQHRSKVTEISNCLGLLAKKQLAWVDGTRLLFGGEDLTPYLTAKGATLSGEQKQLVSMGAYIVIFPDKVYINTEDFTDCGFMEAHTSITASITVQPCMADGSGITFPSGATPPENPESGAYWLDTSSEKHALKVYSAATELWSTVSTTYVKLSYPGIGDGFSVDDAVEISGLSGNEELAGLNGSHLLIRCESDYLVIIGLVSAQAASSAIKIDRSVPELDYICEAQNRLWGCFYGMGKDGKVLNEIYACALGDFKNWRRYTGISTDSYTASIGSDGAWTGCATVQGYPTFFKEECLHKVFVSSTGAHQIVESKCRGVQRGCSKSLSELDGYLYYKSQDGVYVYDGSLPKCISTALGRITGSEAVGGSVGGKYYICMELSNAGEMDGKRLLTYDTKTGIWNAEDAIAITDMQRLGDCLYFNVGGALWCSKPGKGTEEATAIEWFARSGIIGYADTNQKYVSRLVIRAKFKGTMQIHIAYDGGSEEYCGSAASDGLRSFVFPVAPRRCDHFQIRLSGSGDAQIFSISKIYESGSDVS